MHDTGAIGGANHPEQQVPAAQKVGLSTVPSAAAARETSVNWQTAPS